MTTKKTFLQAHNSLFFGSPRYSGHTRTFYGAFQNGGAERKVSLKVLHSLYTDQLGVWNKQRKAASKLMKKSPEYRLYLFETKFLNCNIFKVC